MFYSQFKFILQFFLFMECLNVSYNFIISNKEMKFTILCYNDTEELVANENIQLN